MEWRGGEGGGGGFLVPGAFVMWFIFLMTGQDTSPHHPCVRLSLSPFLMAERPLLLADHSKVGGKSKWPASSTVRPAVHTFHPAESLLWPGVLIPVELHGQTTNSSCRSNISHMNVNGCVDMPMIGTSDRAGQVRTDSVQLCDCFGHSREQERRTVMVWMWGLVTPQHYGLNWN